MGPSLFLIDSKLQLTLSICNLRQLCAPTQVFEAEFPYTLILIARK